MFKRLFVAGLACGLLLGLGSPAQAQTTAVPETRANVIEPALDVAITETTLLFGQGTANTTVSGTGSLSITVSDAAQADQDTTGWSVYCAATALTGPGTIPQASVSAQRTALTFTAGTGPSGDGVGVAPTAGTTAAFTALTANFYLFKSGGTYASTSVTGGTLANMYSRGTWTTSLPGSNFRIAIPNGTAAGTYTGTLTLTIQRGLGY